MQLHFAALEPCHTRQHGLGDESGHSTDFSDDSAAGFSKSGMAEGLVQPADAGGG